MGFETSIRNTFLNKEHILTNLFDLENFKKRKRKKKGQLKIIFCYDKDSGTKKCTVCTKAIRSCSNK